MLEICTKLNSAIIWHSLRKFSKANVYTMLDKNNNYIFTINLLLCNSQGLSANDQMIGRFPNESWLDKALPATIILPSSFSIN